jgi:hypothetical protein
VRLLFPQDFDGRAEAEAAERGYLSHVRVEFDDGRTFPVFFVDPVRLAQEVSENAKRESFFAEVGLIVIPEVTRALMERAVIDLSRRGYFDYFRPLTASDSPWDV